MVTIQAQLSEQAARQLRDMASKLESPEELHLEIANYIKNITEESCLLPHRQLRKKQPRLS